MQDKVKPSLLALKPNEQRNNLNASILDEVCLKILLLILPLLALERRYIQVNEIL